MECVRVVPSVPTLLTIYKATAVPSFSIPKHGTCGVLVDKANNIYWCYDCHTGESGPPGQETQSNTRSSRRTKPPAASTLPTGTEEDSDFSSSPSDSDEVPLSTYRRRKKKKTDPVPEILLAEQEEEAEPQMDDPRDSLVPPYPGGGNFPCAAGTYCKLKDLKVCGRHRCQTCSTTIHNIGGCGEC